jgi:3-oxoacyl-[acyl-carrier protein] reductase
MTRPVVFITGASGGIGGALAAAFAGSGARVALTAHRNLAGLEARIAAAPWRDAALALAADIADPESIDAAMARAAEHFGRVDVCVANSGVGPPDEVPLHRMAPGRIRDVVSVNVLGTIFTARAFLAALARSGPRPGGPGANLVFVSSTAARYGEAGHAEYAASKAAVGGLMLSVKNEIVRLDPLGRANIVEPGWTQTAMVDPDLEGEGIRRTLATMPIQRLAQPEDIADAVLWLASPAARHVSGQVLTVAGGMEGRVQAWPER